MCALGKIPGLWEMFRRHDVIDLRIGHLDT